MSRIITIAAKDIKILTRDRMALALLLGMPIMLIVVLSFALKSEFEASALQFDLPVIDHDQSPESERLLSLIDETEGVTLKPQLDSTEEELRDGVRGADYIAALVVPSGFASGLQGEGPPLSLLIDPGEAASRGVIESVIVNATQRFSAESSNSGSRTVILLDTQLAGEDLSPGVYEQNVPGYAILAAFFITMFLAGSILAERALGTFRRLLSTPVSRSEILLGKMLGVLVVGLTQMTVLFAFGHLVFGLGLGEQPLGLVFITFGVVCAATGLGVLIAGVARTGEQVTGLGTLTVLTMGALGGSMVPRFIMPEAMQTIGLITPHAWAIEGYHEIIVRREGLVDVLPHTAALLAFAAVFFAIGLWRFRFQMAPT